MCISNSIPNTGDYGYAWLIYTPAEWTALGNVHQVVLPVNVVGYAGAGQADRYAYELQQNTYASYKRHKDATVRMIIYTFGNDVFLNLQDIHQHLVGHTPLQLLLLILRIDMLPTFSGVMISQLWTPKCVCHTPWL